jgi:hypothetical protein
MHHEDLVQYLFATEIVLFKKFMQLTLAYIEDQDSNFFHNF